MPEFPIDSFWSYRYVLRLTGRKAAYPPLGLLTFAGYLDQEAWDLELLDLGVTPVSEAALRRRMAAADVVFLSAMSIQKQALVDVVRTAHGLSTPLVLGGPFASSYRDQILHPETRSDRVLYHGLDMLVWGEAGTALPELLAWLDTAPVHDDGQPRLIIPRAVAEAAPGSRRYLNDRAVFRPLEVPLPRWDLARVKAYNSLMLQTTAGCPFRCDFCDIIQFNGGFSRPKAPAAVRRELEAILATGFRGGVFSVDDNFIGSPAATSSILDTMIEFQRAHGYPFSFHTQASVNLGTPELSPLLEKMKLAGFEAVFLGIENPDEDALRRMNKKQNIKVDIPATVAAIQGRGIEVYAGFILGGDEDTPSSARGIVDFVKRTRILTAMTGMLTPVPHTPLYERLRQEGRLRLAEYGGNNTDDVVEFEPAGMGRADLKHGIHEILTDLFQPAEAYRRALDMVSALRPQIFNARRTRLGELRAVAVSLWRQGVRRFDGDYFALLYHAWEMDRALRREARAERRRLRR
ncbi:MAG TPA: B12-binding domain-containing radical SAM protein, partial [Longimicrobiales bacterium]